MNILCFSTQKTNTQNNPDLQNSSQDNQEDISLADAFKFVMLSELEDIEGEIEAFDEDFKAQIKEINEEYKKLQNPTENKKAEYELAELCTEIPLTLGKGVLQLKKDFTKENYEEFFKHVGGFLEEIKEFESEFSSLLEDEEKKVLYDNIKDLQEIPEKSEEIFTAGVVDNKKKEKIIKIIKKVNKPTGKNTTSVENKEPKNNTVEKNPLKTKEY